MSEIHDSMFEQRLSALMSSVFDAEGGPHPSWADSPTARRVAAGEGKTTHLRMPPLRMLALAAVLVVGGAVAGVGAYRLLERSSEPVPTSPVVALPTPATESPVPTPDSGNESGAIAFVRSGSVVVQDITDNHEVVLPGFNSCPRFLQDGRLALASADTTLAGATSWRIEVGEFEPANESFVASSSIPVGEPFNEHGNCFEATPDGSRFAYVSPASAGGGVHVINSDGDTIDIGLTPTAETQFVRNVNAIAWSPDGAYLAMARTFVPTGDSWGDSEVWLWDSERGTVRKLLERVDNHPVDAMSWSPTGHVLAYGGTVLDAGESDLGTDFVPVGSYISTSRVDSANPDPITVNEYLDQQLLMAGGPAWSSDGKQLAWVAGGQLWVRGPDEVDWRATPVSGADLGLGWAIDPVVWSPDSSQILVGQIDSSDVLNDYRSALVLYDVKVDGQPRLVQDWIDGNFGRVTWDGGSQ